MKARGSRDRSAVRALTLPLGRVAVGAAATLLIVLTWVGVRNAILANQAASGARVEVEVASKARVIAEQLRRELLVADQTLHILEMEWERDPAGFDFDAWRRRALALSDTSLQIFMTDAPGIVRASSRVEIVGDDVGERDYFRHEAALPADDGRMFIGSLTRGVITRQWQLNLVRRLDHPGGTFAGVIAASYDASAFGRLQRQNGLGARDLLAVISTSDGEVHGLGDLASAGVVTSIAGSPLFAAMARSADGHWVGRSPLDRVERIDAFAPIPERHLQVVVGIDRADAMRLANAWEREALAFAGCTTVLLLLMAWLLLWVGRVTGQRHAAARREGAVLAEANAQLQAAEARERAKATQLEATLAGMNDGIMMVDAEMRLLAWNARFPQFTGVPPESLRVGLAMNEMLRAQAAAGEFGPVEVEAEVARRMELLRAGGSMGTIARQRPGGRILEIRRNGLPEGGFVTLYSDVTARERAEEQARQAQTMAAIGRLTSGVAHDFNNLLASILGNAEMLHNASGLSPTQARRVSIILQGAGRGAELVRQLLAFARKQTLAPKRVDLNSVVVGMDELLRTTLGAAIRLEMHLDPGLWLALVDPVQSEHVLLNLAINARDAMPDGGVLTIATSNVSLGSTEAVRDLPPGDYLAVRVGDTGTGMTEEVLCNAFEPFFTTKPLGRGSGLGLSQVYGVARQSGGGVRITSRPGEGTTVRVFLPRAEADAPAAAVPAL
ncbi:MAG: PAS-domain containing protein [Pseudomonadota bacterium]|nr:PAS-domain containing protein [Pseudomonadota bacterium]